MCDLWRMSLCPHSLLQQWSSQGLSYSAFDWKAVRSRRQQRVGLPGDRTQGKSKKRLKVRQIYSKVPKTSWAPSSEGLFPISYNAFFTDIGALLSCIKFHHNLHLLITVQMQLKSISKRSPLRQTVLPPGVIEGNGVRCWTANYSASKGITTQPKT